MKTKSITSTIFGITLLAARSIVCAADPLPRSTPEAQGVYTQSIINFVNAADQIDTLHSFMIVRHGYVIAEGWWKPEAPDKRHVMWSVTKSFNATAIGLAVSEGKLSIDDPVLKFFPEDAPANPSDNLKAMKVRDLLTMTAGHASDPKGPFGVQDVKSFLDHPLPYKPGTHFVYSNGAAYVLSAIVTKVTGQTSLAYLTPRLFQPLGIDNPVWDSSAQGVSIGGYGLHLFTEDVAKFGQLYLQKGQWHGRQLVPAEWVTLATSRQVPNVNKDRPAHVDEDWSQGYGFQFWRCTHNAYRADGARGQLAVVMPDQDMVVALTADTGDTRAELRAIWDQLLPGMHDQALPPDPAGRRRLDVLIERLKAHPSQKK